MELKIYYRKYFMTGKSDTYLLSKELFSKWKNTKQLKYMEYLLFISFVFIKTIII